MNTISSTTYEIYDVVIVAGVLGVVTSAHHDAVHVQLSDGSTILTEPDKLVLAEDVFADELADMREEATDSLTFVSESGVYEHDSTQKDDFIDYEPDDMSVADDPLTYEEYPDQ